MKPLDILYKATQRIKTNDLTGPIHYDGDIEFETICHTFNDMQSHLLQAQIKNEQYEKAIDKMINNAIKNAKKFADNKREGEGKEKG